MSTLVPVDCPFACAACDAKVSAGAILGICGRCKTIRYCSGGCCQRDHWPTHKKVCITAGDAAYYADLVVADGPVDPRELNLRDEPQMSDERFDEILIAAKEAREEYEATCPLVKTKEDMKREDMIAMLGPRLVLTDPYLAHAIRWDVDGRMPKGLCVEGKDVMVELLRREVYHRLRFDKEMKALSIMHQNTMIKASDLRKLAWDDPGLLARGLQERMNVTNKRSSDIVAVIAHQAGILWCDTVRIDWLIHSFLFHHRDAMTAGRDDYSFLQQDNEEEDWRIRKMVAILLAVQAEGIDEGVFWEIKDRPDKKKLVGNMRAFARRSMEQPWDRREMRPTANGRLTLFS